MLDTLRRRFVASHTLPLLLIIPLAGFALIYAAETQILIPNLAREVEGQTILLAEIASEHPEIWSDREDAQSFVERVKPYLVARVMLLDAGGKLLASSDPADAARTGQMLEHPSLSTVQSGEISLRTDYSQNLQSEVVDALVPVVTPDRRVIGMVRLTHRLESVYADFLRLRSIVIAILSVALLVGVILGLALALNLERPLRRVTRAVYELAYGQELKPLPEEGPREVRWLLRAFNILVERLKALEESRRKLLTNLVHELGTPLGALNSGLQALRGGADEDAALRQELLLGMQVEIRQLRRLTDDLAELSNELSGGLALNPRVLDLNTWLPRVLAPWREAAQVKGLNWDAPAAPLLPPLNTDSDRLAQVLNNLVSNAIKYTPAGGTVTVATGANDQGVQIRVSDTGPGIPKEEQERIFEPFYRARNAKRFSEGMGLGLTIARDLITAQGGRLTMESAPGQGTTFTIWLPLA